MKFTNWIMNSSYLKKDIAQILDVAPGYLCQLLAGKRKYSKKMAKNIERLTKGEIKRQELEGKYELDPRDKLAKERAEYERLKKIFENADNVSCPPHD